ncbi:hypothetical protein Aab01nite_35160 [Paractinoplanes abujensis]|uniref:Uncharacterized protein n=1 Tax=Paractinoplanes abujensis TaxID=882441 RepID=A0A7W7G6H1_9ACTN|nr:hypothetical protein [Actinoplanes abujensis]GID19926.1 hypothetical protein Aab01nite_35160 [Actinoplanes abujensis]
MLAEQTDEWAEGRCYMGLDLLRKARLLPVATSQDTEPDQPAEIAA